MPIVSFETVAAAAEALQAAGQRPSVRAVIAHLGGAARTRCSSTWANGRPTARARSRHGPGCRLPNLTWFQSHVFLGSTRYLYETGFHALIHEKFSRLSLRGTLCVTLIK